MFRRSSLVFCVLISFVLIFTLGSGGLFHALIPHHHGGNEVIWDGLHGALSHEQKKFFSLLALIFGIGAFFSFALLQKDTELVLGLRRAPPGRGMNALSTALRRGTLAYRKFR